MKKTLQDSDPTLPVCRVRHPQPRPPGWTAISKLPIGAIDPDKLRSWLRDAGFDPLPGDNECESLAYDLMVIAIPGNSPKIEHPLGSAQKHGRLFLHHLSPAIETMEAIPNSARARQGLEAMQAAEREVQGLLELFDYPIKQPSWHDKARLIALRVQRTFDLTEKSYRDVNEDSPLCSFVTTVLGAMGYKKGQSAVSEALRGRRGTGRKRSRLRP
jgi:hypothetical protein